MTCIVGYKENNGDIIIGCDKRTSYGDFYRTTAGGKIFQRNNILFGLSGSLRQAQIIQYELIMPEHDSKLGDLEYLCGVLGAGMREILKKNDAWHVDEGRPDANIHGLIGYNSNIYHMSSDLAFLQSFQDYEVCGSGDQVAIGALMAFEPTTLTKQERVIKSIEIASRCIKSVDDQVCCKKITVKS